jgi:hypothetical protein
LVIIFIIGSYWLYGFLQKNIFNIITQSEEIVILKKEIKTEVVNILSFEKIIKHLEEKQKKPSTDISKTKDIFYKLTSEPEIVKEPEILIETITPQITTEETTTPSPIN